MNPVMKHYEELEIAIRQQFKQDAEREFESFRRTRFNDFYPDYKKSSKGLTFPDIQIVTNRNLERLNKEREKIHELWDEMVRRLVLFHIALDFTTTIFLVLAIATLAIDERSSAIAFSAIAVFVVSLSIASKRSHSIEYFLTGSDKIVRDLVRRYGNCGEIEAILASVDFNKTQEDIDDDFKYPL